MNEDTHNLVNSSLFFLFSLLYRHKLGKFTVCRYTMISNGRLVHKADWYTRQTGTQG